LRYKPEQKKETHTRMVKAAGESFREYGYGGIGVDGLAKAADVTSGAFYKHFKSKSTAYAEVLESGLSEVVTAIEHFKAEHSEDWWKEFAKFYVGERRENPLANSCTLQSLSGETMRANESARALFEIKLKEIIAVTGDNFDDAVVKISILVGGVTLARAVNNPEFSDKIATALANQF
jgi:TetR/AcrR family transcriptional repressor of nem operon